MNKIEADMILKCKMEARGKDDHIVMYFTKGEQYLFRRTRRNEWDAIDDKGEKITFCNPFIMFEHLEK